MNFDELCKPKQSKIRKILQNGGIEIKEKKIKKRCPFSANEDKKILELVKKFDPNIRSNWHFIALQLYGRNARQCRERYNLFLKKGNRTKEKWTVEEDNILLSQYQIYGPHWKKMEKFFKGRTSYSIKNRFNSIKNKMKLNGIDVVYSQNNNNAIGNNESSNSQSRFEKSDEIDTFFKNDDDYSFQCDFEDYNLHFFEMFNYQ